MMLLNCPQSPWSVPNTMAPMRVCLRMFATAAPLPRLLSKNDLQPHLDGPVVIGQGLDGPLILADADGRQGLHGLHDAQQVLGALDSSFQSFSGLHVSSPPCMGCAALLRQRGHGLPVVAC